MVANGKSIVYALMVVIVSSGTAVVVVAGAATAVKVVAKVV